MTYIDKLNRPLVQTAFESIDIRMDFCIGWRRQMGPDNEVGQFFCRYPFPQQQGQCPPTSASNLNRCYFDGFLQSINEIMKYAVWEEPGFILIGFVVPEVF